MRKWNDYGAVKKHPVLEEYIERFRTTSFYNENAGLISYWYLQGQAIADYVRIPIWASALDPRIHMFWIQPTRSGKTIAWEFIGEIAELAKMKVDLFTTGTDAALIGSFETHKEGDDWVTTEKKGLLAGNSCLNFDEGSLLLAPNPKQYFSEVILYLQQAMNPIGSHSNTLTKHMKHGTIKTESRVSIWITTFPPDGVKEHVLTKGLFQRVLLYNASWSEDMREKVSERRMRGVYKNMLKETKPLQYFADHLIKIKEATRHRLLSKAEISQSEWNDMDNKARESVARGQMYHMLTPALDFEPTLLSAVEEYYTLVRGMDAHLSNVVCSFIPNILNYTVIFSTHLAILEAVNEGKGVDEEWTIRGDHVEMAVEMIYDVYEQLIVWLESEVEVGQKTAAKMAKRMSWKSALAQCKTHDLGERGTEWTLKSELLASYGKKEDRSKPVVYSHYATIGPKGSGLFKETKVKGVAYVHWVEQNPSSAQN
jgi:hypothetical protein